ncbi:transient receptor potential cation channel subfamily V member 5 isoform X2 [Plutella xylostella]|uniref:transient receptor potential cation channel subfamily V member 5 isoform X1 n=1 Tax=Plutella xylostella TaxID=51655 RepID=UPI0020330F7D|nr:transient receptor potential cation channel subfamily V member 5 isoform X1 [Plutella xylostella]XP_048481883.1 transient receptor potential cation channel subfamily V member 5 isoform X2 [Plutella xylostella]
MGNTESNVTSGVKKQAGTSLQKLYKLIDLKGGGLLVDMMKRAVQNKQYAEIDHAIKTKVEPFLYNKGKGKYIPISHLVLLRNKERPRHKLLPPLRGFENPDEEFDVDKDWPEVSQEEYDANPSAYRELCWDLKERGAVGETILHLCLLNATSLLADLAKRLLRFYPKLINEIYMSDEYYGESVLHMAIVNEDPTMVKFLLDAGADFHERCCGNFMCPEDQKASRTDSVLHEWVNVQKDTNYIGYVYWGEYPLSFAACLGQEECYRLILARGADPDKQDTNGNTVLHMLVIYEKTTTFDMAYEVGASLYIRNALNLTPLTLAAKLARTELFFHILNIEREIYWQIGATTCAAYPLGQVDTIDTETGLISKDSALNLVVFGEKDEHLELLEGMLIDLLKTKWNTFVKFRFYRQFILFSCYFLVSLVCFTLRPGPPPERAVNGTALNSTLTANDTELVTESQNCTLTINGIQFDPGSVEILGEGKIEGPKCGRFKSHPSNKDKIIPTEQSDNDMEDWWEDLQEECRLMNFDSPQAKVRIFAELVLFLGALAYIGAALREARFLGLKMFIENLSTVPSRVMFLFSCLLMTALPTLRLWCAEEAEDHLAVIIMLTTAPYFLFFCRGFKTVGPFVVMIYRMVMGDLLRFVCIYLVFVMGFSQAYYVIFLSFDNPNTPEGVDDSISNPMPSPMESIMAMFLMSLTSFSDYYTAFDRTDHEIEAKLLFVIYMIIVAVLLVNMLIAMMGNTYQKIAETRNEWQRQWARIVLVVERGVPPAQRLKQLLAYSQSMANGKRALVLRINQKSEEKEEMKEIMEMKRTHEKIVAKRRQREEQLRGGGRAPPPPARDYPLKKANPILK